MGVIDVKAPMAVLPQGAIPFSVVGFFVTAIETIGKGSVLALVTLILGDGMQLETIVTFDVAPLILGQSLGCKKMG